MPTEGSHNFDLKKYVTASIVFTALSQLTLLIYYKNFGINPNYYYETTEVIMSTFKSYLGVCFLLFFFLPFQLFQDTHTSDLSLNGKWPRLMKLINFCLKNITLMAIIVINAIILGTLYFDDNSTNLFSYLLLPLFFFIGLCMLKVSYSKPSILNPPPILGEIISGINTQIAGICIFVLTALCGYANLSAAYTEGDNSYNGTEFIVKETDTVKVTDSLKIIGRSKRCILLLSLPDRKVRVIEQSDITKETIVNTDHSIQLLRF